MSKSSCPEEAHKLRPSVREKMGMSKFIVNKYGVKVNNGKKNGIFDINQSPHALKSLIGYPSIRDQKGRKQT